MVCIGVAIIQSSITTERYNFLDIMASAKVSIDTRALSRRDGRHEVSLASISWPLFGFTANQQYDWEESTEDNYRSDDQQFCGKFQAIRRRLDYSYHSNYSCSRQLFQDTVIDSMLNSTLVRDAETGRECDVPSEPWIIFTAGVMGAGKTHTIKRLHAQGQFPLESFVSVDPDVIRQFLPEFHVYVETSPESAGVLTRKESGFLAEIITKCALERGQNVLLDGSLRDAAWYEKYFSQLRLAYPSLKLGIIHVTAPTEAIFERVEVRNHLRPKVLTAN